MLERASAVESASLDVAIVDQLLPLSVLYCQTPSDADELLEVIATAWRLSPSRSENVWTKRLLTVAPSGSEASSNTAARVDVPVATGAAASISMNLPLRNN